jgi:hypothetical protein
MTSDTEDDRKSDERFARHRLDVAQAAVDELRDWLRRLEAMRLEKREDPELLFDACQMSSGNYDSLKNTFDEAKYYGWDSYDEPLPSTAAELNRLAAATCEIVLAAWDRIGRRTTDHLNSLLEPWTDVIVTGESAP